MFEVNGEAFADGDTCEIAKRSWNQAHIFKLLFITLTLILGVAVLAALVYTFLAFRDDQAARGWLALVTAVVSGAGTAFLGKLERAAKRDEDLMYRRVVAACGEDVARQVA
jgi:hypothetical protein